MKGLLAPLDAVLGVGQNQRHHIPLQLVTNHMQVSQICRAYFVAERGINRKFTQETVSLYFGILLL